MQIRPTDMIAVISAGTIADETGDSSYRPSPYFSHQAKQAPALTDVVKTLSPKRVQPTGADI